MSGMKHRMKTHTPPKPGAGKFRETGKYGKGKRAVPTTATRESPKTSQRKAPRRGDTES
jgi:hypothetical protein